jgi:hypothetical protein
MSPHRSGQGHVRMPDVEFEELADVGLDGEEAALDIRDLRSLLEGLRLVRRTAVQTTVRLLTIRTCVGRLHIIRSPI